ncbi:MAG: M15 family metallopeptidase [Bacillota bacterium]
MVKKIIKYFFIVSILMLVFFSVGCGVKSRAPIAVNESPSLKDTDFVRLDEYIPSVDVKLAYYTENNFTHEKLYDSPVAYLRKGTADKLKKASEEVAQKGYRIRVLDAYRSPRVQFKMWEKYPDSRFVANPHKGFSIHSKGCALDLTLIDQEGNELDMPSAFDEFSPRADRDYRDIGKVERANVEYLEQVMVKHGFVSIRYEWWHFIDSDKDKYDVVQEVSLE